MKIRRYRESDREALTDVWLCSVKGTHDFLCDDDIAGFLPFVRREAWLDKETWVLESDDRKLAGFMSLDADKVDALFIAPEYLHQGLGTRLINHAKRSREMLSVDVNEQNKAACAFYRACGFKPFGRSDTDSQGKPFPLVHMRFSRPKVRRRKSNRSIQAAKRSSHSATRR